MVTLRPTISRRSIDFKLSNSLSIPLKAPFNIKLIEVFK